MGGGGFMGISGFGWKGVGVFEEVSLGFFRGNDLGN